MSKAHSEPSVNSSCEFKKQNRFLKAAHCTSSQEVFTAFQTGERAAEAEAEAEAEHQRCVIEGAGPETALYKSLTSLSHVLLHARVIQLDMVTSVRQNGV